MSVVVPGTGELLDLRSVPTDEIANRLDFFSELTKEVSAFRRAASDELAARLDHEGKRSADVGDFHIEVTPPTEKKWNVELLIDTLDKFTGDGVISSRKAAACIRTTHAPIWNEVKTLLSDPRTAPEISLCFDEIPATRTLKVRRV